MKNKTLQKVFVYIAMSLIAFVTVGPFVLTLFMALKDPSEGFYETILPQKITISNFISAFDKSNFSTYFMNSVIVTAMAVPLNLLFCSLAAYPLARFDFKGKELILVLVIATMMVPFQLYMAPLVKLAGTLGLRNTYIGLLVLQVGNAFGIFLLRQAYIRVPKELEESAYIDGASKFKTWYMIVLPLIKPSLITLAIFTFMNTWGDYLWPLLNSSSDKYTITVGIASMAQNFDGANLKLISAASIIAIIPTLFIFIMLQKYIIGGSTDGAVKG